MRGWSTTCATCSVIHKPSVQNSAFLFRIIGEGVESIMEQYQVNVFWRRGRRVLFGGSAKTAGVHRRRSDGSRGTSARSRKRRALGQNGTVYGARSSRTGEVRRQPFSRRLKPFLAACFSRRNGRFLFGSPVLLHITDGPRTRRVQPNLTVAPDESMVNSLRHLLGHP